MSKLVDNHPLARDVPEFKEQIHDLKMKDAHFLKLMHNYEELDKDIVRAEQGIDTVPDLELDGMKMLRVKLKDELVGLLRATS